MSILLKKFLSVLSAILVLAVFYSFISPEKASALTYVPLSSSVEISKGNVPNTWPISGQAGFPANCNGYPAGQYTMLSALPTGSGGSTNFTNQYVEALPGDTITLALVQGGETCNTSAPSFPSATGGRYDNISANVAGIPATVDFDGNAEPIIAYNGYSYDTSLLGINYIRIRVTIPASIPAGTNTLHVEFDGNGKINYRPNTSTYQCVQTGGNRANFLDLAQYAGCTAGRLGFDFPVEVKNPPTWDVGVSVVCNADTGQVTFNAFKARPDAVIGTVNITMAATLANPTTAVPAITSVNLTDANFSWSSTVNITPPPDFGQVLNATINASPGGAATTNVAADSADCGAGDTRLMKPYLKAYGGEIVSGGLFNTGGTCSYPAPSGYGEIRTFAYPNIAGDYVGSSSHLTVKSLLQVNGLYSASQRAGASPKQLTIANSGSAVADSRFGGDSGNNQCVTDYFTDTQDAAIIQPLSSPGTLSPSDVNPNQGVKQYSQFGDLTIGTYSTVPTSPAGTTTIGKGTQVAIFVDGDVYINDNIAFSGAARGSTVDIPNLYIIARGNIYISPKVLTIEGTYIAQPKDVTETDPVLRGGVVYTCSENNNPRDPFPSAAWAVSCQNSMVINGGILAERIYFMRTYGAISATTNPKEAPRYVGGASPTFSNGAAEIVNYSPEVYLAPSPLKDSSIINPSAGGRSVGRYDSIKSLQPVY